MIIDTIEIHQDWKTKEIKVICKPCVVTKETEKQIKVSDGNTQHTIRKSELPKNVNSFSKPQYFYERGQKHLVLAKLEEKFTQEVNRLTTIIEEDNEILRQVRSMAGELNEV